MTATTSLTRTMRVSLLEGLLRGAVVDPEVARAVDENPTAVNELGYDPWGFHPETAKVLYSVARRVYNYFRQIGRAHV